VHPSLRTSRILAGRRIASISPYSARHSPGLSARFLDNADRDERALKLVKGRGLCEAGVNL